MLRENNHSSSITALIMGSICVILFFILLNGYYSLQITEYENYKSISTTNIVRAKDIMPGRGDIFDRKLNLLVDNRPAFSIYIYPNIYLKDSSFRNLVDIIVKPESKFFKRLKARRYSDSESILAKKHIDEDLKTFLIENKLRFKGLDVLSDPKRNFNSDINLTHVIGFTSEINESELKKMPEFKLSDVIGKDGIEKYHNTLLFGQKGKQSYIFDAKGNLVSQLSNEFGYHEPEKDGYDIITSIDSRMQFVAESLLVGKVGAIVAIDVRDGGILAMASSPTYDPIIRTQSISNDIWNQLTNPVNNNPLLNRNIQGLYPPGSVYKMVAALTALNKNIVSENWSVNCNGYFQLGNKVIKCWNAKGHGAVNMKHAIKYSCNVYFYQLGLKIGLDYWEDYSKAFGFGQLTKIDIPYEQKGIVPSHSYYEKKYKGGYSKGHLAILAIGQGELLVTPLQLAQYTMILANKGFYYPPHFLIGTIDKYSHEKKRINYQKYQIIKDIKNSHWQVIHDGMFEVVNKPGGTALSAALTDVKIAGKTGTAQVPPADPHAWFLGFAPFEKPEIAIVVLVENGRAGGGTAAPIARALFEQYFYGFVIPRFTKEKVNVESIDIPDLEIPEIKIDIPQNLDDM